MTTTPAPNDHDALKALEQAATPAPWAHEHEGGHIVHGPDGTVAEADYAPDAAFIAAARNALPALQERMTEQAYELSQVHEDNARLSEELAKTRAELDTRTAQRDDWLQRFNDHAGRRSARIDELDKELEQVTGVAKALRITVAEMLSGKQHTHARTLTWESTLKYATEALANPATTAETAAKPTKANWSEFGDCGCGAKRGESCIYTTGLRAGRPRTWPHPERFDEFQAEPAAS